MNVNPSAYPFAATVTLFPASSNKSGTVTGLVSVLKAPLFAIFRTYSESCREEFQNMQPEEAAYAGRMLGVKEIIPMHYATFPMLTGQPQQLEEKLSGSGIRVRKLQPGSQ